MNSEDVLSQIAGRLRARKNLNSDVVKSVVETVLKATDALASVDTLDTQLYNIAMRRAEKK